MRIISYYLILRGVSKEKESTEGIYINIKSNI